MYRYINSVRCIHATFWLYRILNGIFHAEDNIKYIGSRRKKEWRKKRIHIIRLRVGISIHSSGDSFDNFGLVTIFYSRAYITVGVLKAIYATSRHNVYYKTKWVIVIFDG